MSQFQNPVFVKFDSTLKVFRDRRTGFWNRFMIRGCWKLEPRIVRLTRMILPNLRSSAKLASSAFSSNWFGCCWAAAVLASAPPPC